MQLIILVKFIFRLHLWWGLLRSNNNNQHKWRIAVVGECFKCNSFRKRSSGAGSQKAQHGQQERTQTYPKYKLGLHLLAGSYPQCSKRYKTFKGIMRDRAYQTQFNVQSYELLFQIKTLRLAISYIAHLLAVVNGNQDPSCDFRAELVPSSRKINAERRAQKSMLQVSS